MKQEYQWPLQPSADFTDFNYFTIASQVDHDPGPGILDYSCGTRTYNGHRGTDIGIYPFNWNMMEANMIAVVAAAPGTITYRHDGEFDKNCDSKDVPGNLVMVKHGDGSTAWYAHLKKGSVTPKQVGETVIAGEQLGTIGSSGHSSGPHLHFEVHDPQNVAFDPFRVPGGCNPVDGDSWSAEQLPYHDPRVHKIMFGDALFEYSPVCGVLAVTHERDTFCPGETVYLSRFFSGIDVSESVTVTLRDANDQIFWSIEHVLPVLRTQSWSSPRLLPPKAALGPWTFSVTHQGVEYARSFMVDLAGCPPLPCASAVDCPSGQVCFAAACTPGDCVSDVDCGVDELCEGESHTCAPAPDDDTGTTDASTGDADTGSETTSGSTTGGTGEAMSTGTSDAMNTDTGGPAEPPGSETGDEPSNADTGDEPATSTTAPGEESTTIDPSSGSGAGDSDTPTGGDPEPSMTSTTSTTAPTSTTSTTSTTGSAGEPGLGVDDGCSCAGGSRGPAPLVLLVALGLCRRSRRARALAGTAAR